MLRSVIRACVLCLTVAACLLAVAPASAAPNVDWRTTGCYFDDNDKPVLVGHFVNDGSEPVLIARLRLQLYLQEQSGDLVLIAAGVWDDVDTVLRPGEQSRTFRLRFGDHDGRRFSLDRCILRGDVTYRIFRGADA